MRIGIDLDGVAVDIMTPFIAFHNERYGSDFTYEGITEHQFWNPWGLTREEGNLRLLEFMDMNEFSVVKPQEGAIEAIRKLAEEHELIVVTSRPDSYTEKTLEWIEYYLPGVFSRVLFTHQISSEEKFKKKAICSAEKIEVLIEDFDWNVLSCADVCKKIIVFDQPWNKGAELPENAVRVMSWEEVLNIVGEMW
ncbi:MAG: hypothetical protein KKD18_01970 [Nanoarchaeota archaeon]|nr:hypothetical protein [Nanoarchaeota archaeon]MBU0977158.1 hypothetical protein [Nanoarchaeota archaeon]